MNVELISVGTELLLGNIVNTNANYLSKMCAQLGFTLYYQITVGDNEERVTKVLKTSLERSDIIILTGGLGPTEDDMTKEAVAKVLHRELIMDEVSKKRIKSYFDFKKSNSSRSSDITENNWKQAMKIDGSIIVENDNGTAPGYIVETAYKLDEPNALQTINKRIILLPGPPSEMIPMFKNHIMPYLRQMQDKVLLSKMIKICGIGESRAETMILDLIEKQDNPTIAPYAKCGEVYFRITASAKSAEAAEKFLQPVEDEFRKRFGLNIYTMEEEMTLEEVVVQLLEEKKLTLATAESCTGGLVAGRIINVPGASCVFNEGFITYSNEAKMKYLGVSEQILKQYGAVSEQTAYEMANGTAAATGADLTLAVTGLAGPDGETERKPVGLVYISCCVKGEIIVKEYHMKGNREKIREQSVVYALDLLRRCALEY
jgi:nicotinamide-nucleotide amidase